MAETLKDKTTKGLFWGAVNTLSTQVLSLALGIVLARRLSPDDYGMVGMLAIFTAIAMSLQDSGFSSAIANMKQPTHRDYNAVFWFSTLMSAVIYVLLFLSAPLIADFFDQPALVSVSRLVFASCLMAGMGIAYSAYMFRNMMNREKAVVNMVALIVSGGTGLALAYLDYGYWSLAWQQFVYICVTNAGRLFYVRWRPSLQMDFSPLRQIIGFSSKILVTNILTQVNNNLLSFFFGKLFPVKQVGDYTQAAKWNTMASSMISGTIQQVAQPVLASVSEEENRQQNVFRKMLRFTAFLSMPAMLGLAFVAEEFIVLLIKDKWIDCVPLLRLLCISGAFLPIQTLYQNLFISNGRSDTYMWCTIAQILAQAAVVWTCSADGIQTMVAGYAAILIIWVGVWQVLARRLIGLSHLAVLKDITPFLLSAVACIGVAYWLTQGVEQPIVLLPLRILIVAILYVLTMKLARVRIFSECVEFFTARLRHK